MKLRLPVIAFLITGCCARFAMSAASDTLFFDNFQDAATSNGKWIYPAEITHTFSNGMVTLKSSDPTYLYFATHNMASKAAVFTLSATITMTSTSNGVGISFCMDSNNNGIAVQAGTSQNLLVYKYDSGIQEILSVVNSFVSPTINTIKVSKHDSTFNIFCNNRFITTFYLSASKFIGGGDIGLLVPPNAQATFDNILMTNHYETGATIRCFSDNFSDANLDGWFVGTLTGQSQTTSGGWLMTNTDAQSTSIPFVNGSFDRASYRVVTTYKSGGSPYGLAIVFPILVAGGTIYKPYSFVIDSARHYGYGHPDSGSIKISQPKTYIHGSTGDGKDTLEVLRFNNKYKFRINGTVAEDSLPLRGAGNVVAAGLFLMPQTAVLYHDFIIGGDSAGAACSIITVLGKPKAFAPRIDYFSNDYALFDATGRRVKRMSASGMGNLPRLPAGMYFVRRGLNGKTAYVNGLMSVR